MVVSFDHAPERPESIQTILNGLDRYNPETTTTFQDYVMSQCENKTYDCYANLALLKLYVPSRCPATNDEPLSKRLVNEAHRY
jgi:translation initiation factor 3 subunit K